MNASTKIAMVAYSVPTVESIGARIPARTETPRYEAAKHVALMVAAPLIGLGFVIAFPFIGLGTIAWMSAPALVRRMTSLARFLKNVALFLAAPFIGLAYALAFPFVGTAILVWRLSRAWAKPHPAA